jgi:hypothetical protein
MRAAPLARAAPFTPLGQGPSRTQQALLQADSEYEALLHEQEVKSRTPRGRRAGGHARRGTLE